MSADYGKHAKRNTYGFVSPGRVEPQYYGRHRQGLPYNGIVVFIDGRFRAITAAGQYLVVG